MTAIAGFWGWDASHDSSEQCDLMIAALAAYGPDDHSCANIGDLALGRALFRLLPEDIYDRQPLFAGEGRYSLVADLRLDNRPELIVELGVPQQQALALSDSALLLLSLE